MEAKQSVLDIVSEYVGKPIQESDTPESLGLSSLDMMDLLCFVEEKMDKELSDDLLKCSNIGEFVHLATQA